MGVLVIVCYRPKPGGEEALMAALRDHLPILRGESLVTDRPPYLMRAKDRTLVEVFEWKSQEAIASAHENAAVLALWERFGACCEYGRIADVAEAKELFSAFEPVDLSAASA